MPALSRSLRGALILLGLAGPVAALACDLDRPLSATVPATSLLDAVSALAAASNCRIVLAPALAQRAGPALDAQSSVADALDALAIAAALNWSQRSDQVVELVAADAAAPLQESTLSIAADAETESASARNSLTELARLPSERSVAIARTRIDAGEIADTALHEYGSAVTRAPGVYGMAASDVIRGVSASRVAPNQRASLITIDGVPVPAEAWLFNRPGLGLMQSFEITRSATGMATAYGAGAGDLAIGTRAPAAAFGGSVGVSHAPALAPMVHVAATGGLGVPGMQGAFGASRQIGGEEIAAEQQPDVFQQRQYALRLAWQSPERTHQLQASVLDFARADLGGGEGPCGGGQPHCLLGSDVDIHGAGAAWQWRPGDRWQISAQAGSSDTRAALTRRNGQNLVSETPAYVHLQHADLRLERDAGAHGLISAGLLQANRGYRVHGSRRFSITPSTSSSLGMIPAAPGPASLAYDGAETARSDLPQAYAEFLYDDETRWDGHIGLRHVAAESRSQLATSVVSENNCRLVTGRYDAAIETCSDALGVLVQERNARIRHHETLWLPSLGLRHRFNENHWLALLLRDSFLGSDLDTLALSPRSTLEKLRTAELAWSRPLLRSARIEARLFHHHWRDRVANFTSPENPDAIHFASKILGAELQWLWQPRDDAELWANASGLHSRSTLQPESLAAAAVRGAPEWSAGIGGRLHFAGDWYAGSQFSHAAPTWIVNDDASIERLGARNLLDLRVGWRRGRFDLALWGSNLLDDDYIADSYGRGLLLTPYHAYNRIVGIDARYGF